MRLPALLSLFLCLPLAAAAAELPAYFHAAFARLTTDAPRGWAYTLRTMRGDGVTVERYDPSRPKGGEWTLLERDGRAPDAAELERYLRYKAANTPPSRATFERGDIDLGTAVLAREEAAAAEFQMLFREDVSAPLLPHLALVLIVDRRTESIREYTLRLRAPFSSGLGMRMQELVATTRFTPPEDGRPALPRETVSHFRGRLFFLFTVEEDLRVEFSDFERVR